MVELYKQKGFAEEDARQILTLMMKNNKEFFIEHMLVMELGFMAPDEDANPAKNGLVTFLSFIAFGSVPMWVYVIIYGAGYTNQTGTFGIACAFTAITMFLLGAVQAKITRQNIFKSGMTMMLNGSAAAAAAFLIGWGLESAIGRGEC